MTVAFSCRGPVMAQPRCLCSSSGRPALLARTTLVPARHAAFLQGDTPAIGAAARPARRCCKAAALAQSEVRAQTPLVGSEAPDFIAEAVFDQEFQTVTLSQYRGKKYVVLFFYPLDFTFVCPTEITAFSDKHAEFAKTGAEILGVSVDSQFSHLAWCQTDRNQGGVGDLAYPLVSDLKRDISTKYNVLTPDGVALRALFIIDKEGIVQHATINNLAFGRNVEESLRILQAIQYVQENPDEVCPAGWQPGQVTMKPTPKDSKEYFAAL